MEPVVDPALAMADNLMRMPELPEVETVRRGLEQTLAGRRVRKATLRRKDLRFPLPRRFCARLEGRRIERVARRGKYLLCHLDDGLVLLIHLGMTGRFTVFRPAGAVLSLAEDAAEHAPEAAGTGLHDHVLLDFDDGTRVVYTDPRRFGLMDLVAAGRLSVHRLLRGLGAEPLEAEFDAACLARLLEGSRAPLKAALLDQRRLAGLGNIYVCEALHRAGLSPRRRAGSLVKKGRPDPRLTLLAVSVREVLNDAIAAGGSTLRDYASADGSRGAFQNRFDVYDREGEPCRRRTCRGRIRRITQAGRSTFFCPVCQQ
jgi:formamidopyrimidine-DNA glycosylase